VFHYGGRYYLLYYVLTESLPSQIFDLIQWVFLLVSIGSGYGHHPDYVDPQRLIPLAKFLFLCQPVSVWALSCAKISVACCLLRIQRGVCSASRRTFLFCLIGLQVIITAIINYFQLNTCRPLRANWGESAPDTQCIDQAAARTSIYVNLAMIAFTDLTFALLPLSMLRDRPPVHEKVAIYSIVLTGFLSTGATVARMTFVKDFVIGSESPETQFEFRLTRALIRGHRGKCGRINNLYKPRDAICVRQHVICYYCLAAIRNETNISTEQDHCGQHSMSEASIGQISPESRCD